MKINLSNLLVYAMAWFIISCSSQKIALSTKVTEYMGGEYTSENNSTGKLQLTWNTRDAGGTPVLKYAVWDLEKEEMIYSGSAIHGKVFWLSETSLEVHDYPGIIDDNNPLYRYRINLLTKVKTPIREEEKL